MINEWMQLEVIHCPNDCTGMLLQNPMEHEMKCSVCGKFFILNTEFIEVKR